MKDFDLFKKWFLHYQKLFGLTGYKVYFRYEVLESGFAQIVIQQDDMVATAILNSVIPKRDKPFKEVKLSAKHEATHLLLSGLEFRALDRWSTRGQIDEIVEGLVNKLTELIQ